MNTADTVISFAETHMQPLTEWQRRLIRWAFRGDGQQPLVVAFQPRRDGLRQLRETGDDHRLVSLNPSAPVPYDGPVTDADGDE